MLLSEFIQQRNTELGTQHTFLEFVKVGFSNIYLFDSTGTLTTSATYVNNKIDTILYRREEFEIENSQEHDEEEFRI